MEFLLIFAIFSLTNFIPSSFAGIPSPFKQSCKFMQEKSNNFSTKVEII